MKKYIGVSTLEVLVHAKNYNKWIADSFLSHFEGPVLEIGAGTGNLSSHFLKHTPFFITDGDAKLVEQMKKRFAAKKNIYLRKLNILKEPPKEFYNKFKTVITINVLEHLEDDEKALQHMYSLIKPGGKLLVLVPAMKFAYTRFDKQLGHYRRYKKKELTELLQQSGFVINDMYYFNIVGLVSWIIRDKVERSNVDLKPYQVALFDKIVPFLRFIESKIRPPIGVSLIVIAHKK